MYAELFGQKLAKARKDAGYTQISASKALGIPAGTIANWEIGRTQPDLESIGIMADFYAVSVDWLLGTKGQNFNPNTSPSNYLAPAAPQKAGNQAAI